MIFENILGNDNNKIFLKNILKNNTVSHSYMFIGKSSIGKMLFAMEFAKGILCNNLEDRPCNNCISCIKFKNSNHPDFFLLDEKENTIKNEQIREINRSIIEKPIECNKKVYIINNSNNMTVQAQNSLLKTLEEPPEYAVIILVTETENKMLNTIRSRCTKIYFNPLKEEEVRKILKEKYKIENLTQKTIKLAGGSIEKTLKVKENEETYNLIENIFTNIENIDIVELLKQKDKIFENKSEIEPILDYMAVIFNDLLAKNKKYLNCIFIIENTKERLYKNCNFDMAIDNLLFRIWEEIHG